MVKILEETKMRGMALIFLIAGLLIVVCRQAK